MVSASAVTSAWLIVRTRLADLGPLRFEPTGIDLGDLMIRESRPFEVRIRNVSGEPVEFARVTSGCTCANVGIECARLEPGEATKLSGVFRGTSQVGSLEQEIVVLVAQHGEMGYRIPMRGRVRRRIDFAPASLILEPDFAAARSGEGQFEVRNTTDQTVEILEPADCPSGLRLILRDRSVAPGESVTIAVQVDSLQVTPRDESIVVRCSHPVESVIPMPVAIRPVGAITVNPAAIHFGVVPEKEVVGRVVHVELAGELLAHCHIEPVRVPAFLSLQSAERTSLSTMRLAFSVKAAGGGAAMDGNTEIPLRHNLTSRAVTLVVPVSGFVIQ
jgi:hypothetical protein